MTAATADRRRPAFWGVMLAFLVHGLVVATWVSRIPALKSALRLSDGALGFALLGAAVGSVTAVPFSGALVTRYGSRQASRWTSIGFCMALLALASAQNVPAFVAALIFYGLMAGGNDVAMNAQAVATEKVLGSPTMSRFHAMFSFGGIVGALAGGFAAGRGVPAAAHLGVAAVLFACIAVGMGPMLIDTHQRGAERKDGVRLRSLPLSLVALSGIGFCILLSEGAIADWTTVYLKQVLHAGEGLAPAGYAVFSAAMAAFRFAGDAITRRLGRPWTIRGGAMIAAVGLLLVVCTHSPYWALAGFAYAGVGFSSIIPLVFAAGGRIPSVSEGAGVATVSGIGYIAFLVGPPVIGMISEVSSLRAGLALLVVLSAAAAILVGLVERVSLSGTSPLRDVVAEEFSEVAV